MQSAVASARRVVVKVGSALVTNDGRGLDREAIEKWATQISALQHDGKQVILVSSGAVAEGVLRLGWEKRPSRICEVQAAAAVGQMGLVQAYETSFAKHGIKTAQILLTHADLSNRERYLNARDTVAELLSLGVVPIINENDTVVTDEIKVGDKLLITGPTTGAMFVTLEEARVDLKPVDVVPKGVHVSFKVPGRIRPSDKLYRMVPTEELRGK